MDAEYIYIKAIGRRKQNWAVYEAALARFPDPGLIRPQTRISEVVAIFDEVRMLANDTFAMKQVLDLG